MDDLVESPEMGALRESVGETGTGGRDASGRFAAGNPGRPKGSRNRMTNRLAMALLDDFTAHEEDNLRKMRRWYFTDYVRLMGRFLPAHVKQVRPDFGDYTPAETARVVAAARAALRAIEHGEAGLEALAAVLDSEPGALGEGP